jgi:hypothetical protein
MCDILGQNKNCNQCLFSENCEYKNESKWIRRNNTIKFKSK